MALIKAVKISQTEGDEAIAVWQWGPMTFGDTCAAVSKAQWPDRSVQVEGSFQTSSPGNLAIEGSIDGVNWHVLHDTFGNLLNIAQAGIYSVNELTGWIRANPNAGDAGTSLTVTLIANRVQPLRV